MLAIYGNEDHARYEFSPAWTVEQVEDLIYSQSDVFLGDPGVPFVFAAVDTRNDPSWQLMERLGMRREAHFIHANLEGPDWTDDSTYAMLEHEWYAKR